MLSKGSAKPRNYATFGAELVRKPKKAENLNEVIQELCEFINTKMKAYEAAGVGIVKLLRCNFKDLIVSKIKATTEGVLSSSNTKPANEKFRDICELIDEAFSDNYAKSYTAHKALNFGSLGRYLDEIRNKILALVEENSAFFPDKFEVAFPRANASHNQVVSQYKQDVDKRNTTVIYTF